MIKLIYTEQALLDLERLSAFLLETDPQAGINTAALIFDALEVLVQHPEIVPAVVRIHNLKASATARRT